MNRDQRCEDGKLGKCEYIKMGRCEDVHHDAFTRGRFDAEIIFLHTHSFTHIFYPRSRRHFTHRLFYTRTLLDADAFTHRPCYTQTLLHTKVEILRPLSSPMYSLSSRSCVGISIAMSPTSQIVHPNICTVKHLLSRCVR